MKPIRRQRQIAHSLDRRDLRDELFQLLTQKRFTTRQAHLLNAKGDGNPHHALNFFEGKKVRTWHPLPGDRLRMEIAARPASPVKIRRCLRLWQTIHTSEIAAVRDA